LLHFSSAETSERPQAGANRIHPTYLEVVLKVALRFAVVVLLLITPALSQTQEKVDLEMVTKIRYEGFRNSQIREIAEGLLEAIGPRLTGSPNMKRANEWTRDQLAKFGLVNAHLEAWGPFGRGWSNEYVNVRMLSPDIQTFIAYPKAWTPGTEGAIRGECVRANIKSKDDFPKYKGGGNSSNAISTRFLPKRNHLPC